MNGALLCVMQAAPGPVTVPAQPAAKASRDYRLKPVKHLVFVVRDQPDAAAAAAAAF